MINWDQIRVAYVTSELTRKELAKLYKVQRSALDKAMARERWVTQRAEWRRDTAAKSFALAQQEVLRQQEKTIKLVYGLKLKVAQQLAQKLKNDEYRASVRDLDILQRLEMDLLGLDVNKRPPGTSGGSVEMRIEILLEQLGRERSAVAGSLAQLEVVESLPATSKNGASGHNDLVAEFLYGSDDDDDGNTEDED